MKRELRTILKALYDAVASEPIPQSIDSVLRRLSDKSDVRRR
jgi:hypothetical protein